MNGKELYRRRYTNGWKTKGDKLTNIAFLTEEVGISTGSFYRLYETKEELLTIQNQLKEQWNFIMRTNPGIEGFKTAMKWSFEDYIKYPIIF